MLKFTAVSLLTFFLTIQLSAQTATLKVEVNNINPIEGNLKLGIFSRVHDYRTKSNPFLRSSKVVTDTVAIFSFENVPFGRYAAAVYHDENGDDTLNVKKLGIPIEGIGFSGKFNSRIKPPDFPLASFRLKSDTTISIRLIYHKRD
jgi:uncharacterized protein (DUF2141 family)